MSRLDDALRPFELTGRAIMNFKVNVQKLPDGRCHMTVSTLYDTVIMTITCAQESECERHLREAGFKRIPSYVASEIDQIR